MTSTTRSLMRRLRTIAAAIAALALLSLDVGPAFAQQDGRRVGPRVIELEEMVIEGRVAKPQVFYVLGRSRFQYEGIKLQRSFVHRIVESATKNPF